MLIRHFLLFTCLLIVNAIAFGQRSPKVNHLTVELSQLSVNDTNRVEIYRQLSWSLNQSSPGQAMDYADSAIDLARKHQMQLAEASALNAKGVVYYYISSYPEAIKCFYQVVDIYHDLGLGNRLSSTYTNIGNSYEKMMASPQALEYQRKALALVDEDDHSLRGAILNNIGNIFIQEEDYDSAMYFHRHALRYRVLAKEPDNMGYSYQNLGLCYLRQNMLLTGIAYMDSAYVVYQQYDNDAEQANVAIELAIAQRQLRNFTLAANYLDTALMLSQQVGNLNSEMLTYKEKSQLLEDQQLPDQALRFFKQYNVLRDTLFNHEREQEVFALHTRFQLEKKDKEMAQLQLTVARANHNRLVATLITLLVIVVLIGVFIYARLQMRKQDLRAALLLKEKESQSRELDDKKRELMTQSLHQQQKKELLYKINDKLLKLGSEQRITREGKFKELKSLITENLQFDECWSELKLHFEGVHPNFFIALEHDYPALTANEKRLCAYIKLNLSTKDISRMLHVEEKSVQMARYRLKKKMNIPADTDLNFVIHRLEAAHQMA